MPGAQSREQNCEGGAVAECLRNESGVSARFDLDGDDSALADVATLFARTFETPTAAQETVQTEQVEDAETFDGEFDTPQDRNVAGLRGSGSIRELSIDGWDGYLLTREFTLVFGGEPQFPLSDSRSVPHGGPQVIRISTNAAEDSDLDHEALARQLAEEYIGRLRESA